MREEAEPFQLLCEPRILVAEHVQDGIHVLREVLRQGGASRGPSPGDHSCTSNSATAWDPVGSGVTYRIATTRARRTRRLSSRTALGVAPAGRTKRNWLGSISTTCAMSTGATNRSSVLGSSEGCSQALNGCCSSGCQLLSVSRRRTGIRAAFASDLASGPDVACTIGLRTSRPA